MTSDSDTIVALASPAGRGGIAVVRMSGPQAFPIAIALSGDLPPVRKAALRRFVDADGQPLDVGLLLRFSAPASFTGEDVVEFHLHGGRIVSAGIVDRCVALGARRAQAGEFSRRAYLNDRLDLAQAEAIASIIDSGSQQAARAALRSLEGEFSVAVIELVELLTQLRMHVEAAIDFPEEEIDFLSDSALEQRMLGVERAFDILQAKARQGRLLSDGYNVVLIGAPNAGKSSLLNALAGSEAAIVTAIPGTTRDPVRVSLDIDGLPVDLVDTAGLRDAPDTVERIGVERARTALARADLALLIADAAAEAGGPDPWAPLERELPVGFASTRVLNKIDLVESGQAAAAGAEILVSALTGAGLDALRAHIAEAAGYDGSGEGSFAARRRHIEAIEQARRHFHDGCAALLERRAGELMAEELRLAQQALGEITGEFSSDDLLGRIFGEFCIGK